jgi:hypothetical protein
MDAIGFALIGIGGYLMYSAYKGNAPFVEFMKVLKPKTTYNPANPSAPINAQGGTGTAQYLPAG